MIVMKSFCPHLWCLFCSDSTDDHKTDVMVSNMELIPTSDFSRGGSPRVKNKFSSFFCIMYVGMGEKKCVLIYFLDCV